MGQTLIKMIREDKGGAAAVAENSAEGMTETEQNRIKEELREIVLSHFYSYYARQNIEETLKIFSNSGTRININITLIGPLPNAQATIMPNSRQSQALRSWNIKQFIEKKQMKL